MEFNLPDKTAHSNIYEYKGKYYHIIAEVMMKNPETRKWCEAVLYDEASLSATKTFVREKNEFYERFRKI